MRGAGRPRERSVLMKNRRFVVVVVSFYLLGVGVLTGMLIERVRFDEARSVLFTQLEEDTHTLHERLMAIEHEADVKR
jgi:hypothetical protein